MSTLPGSPEPPALLTDFAAWQEAHPEIYSTQTPASTGTPLGWGAYLAERFPPLAVDETPAWGRWPLVVFSRRLLTRFARGAAWDAEE